jgi:transposase
MINIDTGRIVDMLESREPGDVAKWLGEYPNIKVVSRDGSQQYAAAIKEAHPEAVQVSDRFHLVKNLTDYAKQHISKIVTSNFRITCAEGEPRKAGGYWEQPEPHGADLPTREHNASTEKKQDLVEKVRMLAGRGLSLSDVAKEAGVSNPTAKKYMREDFDPANKDFGSKRPSKLKPYTDRIDAMLRERRTFGEIESAIRGDGYDGAASTIRMYATRQRRIMKAANEDAVGNTDLIERKWVIKVLYKPIEKIKEMTSAQLDKVIEEHPDIGVVYKIVRSFKEIMFAKRASEMEAWIETTSNYGIDEINSFINGISADLDAVKNAVALDYNNGLAEGSVNKIKVIKRIMYGRCSFRTLRNKILTREMQRRFN